MDHIGRPSRHELKKLVKGAFDVYLEGRVAQFANKRNCVLNEVSRRGNVAGYVPALTELECKRLQEDVLVLAKVYAKEFTHFGRPCDAGAELDLEMTAKQMAGGAASSIRGQLERLEKRINKHVNLPAGLSHIQREIAASMSMAVKEGKLELYRQRLTTKNLETSLQRGPTPPRPSHLAPQIEKASTELSPTPSGRIAESQFSGQHKAQFGELLAMGVELHALNRHREKLDFGPWSVGCDQGDSDTRVRIRARFRAAARKAAIAAGAPFRVNLLDWWISRLARGQRLPFIQGLIQRSVEYCEELESNALELSPLVDEEKRLPGLCRDRYPCDFPVFF
jgi:hypothetical protein